MKHFEHQKRFYLSYSQILAALPDTKEILLVHGNLGLEQDDGLVQNFVSKVPVGIGFRYFNPGKYPEQTLTALRNSAAGTPIIYINYKFYERNWETVHNWITTQTKHPVFTIFAHNVSRYAGGAVVVPERIADAAIALAAGEQLPAHQNRVVSQQFNAQQLDRWGIDAKALPPGAELVNQEPSVYSLEVVLVIVSFFLVVIVVMTIFMLYRAHLHNKNMARALVEADSANRSKSDFLANMSHEIRTPMNGVLGTLQVLERSDLTSHTKERVSKALFSAKHLLTIINDILDYSKIEAQKLDLENVEFQLRDNLSDTMEILSFRARTKA